MNELTHWGLKRGARQKLHKYIKRLGTPGNYTYIYPEDIKNKLSKINLEKPNINNLKNKIFDSKKTIGRKSNSLGNKKTYAQKENYKKRLKNDNLNKELTNSDLDKLFKKKKKNTTRSQDQTRTNPNYNPYDDDEIKRYQYTNNCALCTVAYDLRRRGYDVEAKPASLNDKKFTNRQGVMQQHLDRGILSDLNLEKQAKDFGIRGYYKGEKYIEGKTKYSEFYKSKYDYVLFPILARERKVISKPKEFSKKVEKDMLKGGEGSRYYCTTTWKGGGGHAFICEVNNGKVKLRDAQSNKRLKVNDYMQYAEDFNYFRVDNIQPTRKCRLAVKNRRK